MPLLTSSDTSTQCMWLLKLTPQRDRQEAPKVNANFAQRKKENKIPFGCRERTSARLMQSGTRRAERLSQTALEDARWCDGHTDTFFRGQYMSY